ncbi:MAG: galactokinase [Flavobacteriales bacterium]|nr:galactokinase [Flavobacteriales bacterium]
MQHLTKSFSHLFGKAENIQGFFSPGRVNLIGEHIDYVGGLVMPMAISLGITALARKNFPDRFRIHSTDFEETVLFDLDHLPTSKQDHWSDFALGVILHLKSGGMEISGCDILLDSNLPKGSGLSSSAALEVLVYYTLCRLHGIEPDRTQMSLDCQKIENEFIGVNCGIMDQFAVANGKAGHAMLLDCNSLDCEHVPLDLGNHSLLIINSKKPRALAESAYNQRRAECAEALRIIRQHRPMQNLVEANETDLELLHDPILKQRTRHAFTENQRVNKSAEALRSGNLIRFGALMSASHISLRDDCEVSCAELDLIVATLLESENCLGARMTGAGFGGCCIALVRSNAIESISSELKNSYQKMFGHAPEFYTCAPSVGVHQLLDV